MNIHYLELSANFFYLTSTVFAGKNSIHTWWTGIISCALFMITFFNVQLYAEVTLQMFFMTTCVYGWKNWKKGGANKKSLKISKVKINHFILYGITSLVVATVYGYALYKITDASNPFWDSTILTLSILGQFLVMKRKFENWYIWFIVDSIAIPLYSLKGLYLTSLLYVVLLGIAIYGYFNWKKSLFICPPVT